MLASICLGHHRGVSNGLRCSCVSSGCLRSTELKCTAESMDSSDYTSLMTAKIAMTIMEIQTTT